MAGRVPPRQDQPPPAHRAQHRPPAVAPCLRPNQQVGIWRQKEIPRGSLCGSGLETSGPFLIIVFIRIHVR